MNFATIDAFLETTPNFVSNPFDRDHYDTREKYHSIVFSTSSLTLALTRTLQLMLTLALPSHYQLSSAQKPSNSQVSPW